MGPKTEDTVLEVLREMNKNTGSLYEEDIEKMSLEYDLSIKQILYIISKLELGKIEVKSGERPCTGDYPATKEYPVLKRIRKYNKENELLANRAGNEVKEMFFRDLAVARCQASYIPVFLICFFQNADEDGCLDLDALSVAFADYYKKRKSEGLVVEKINSILRNDIFPSMAEVKRLLLFNPLGRSFLIKYFNEFHNDSI